MTSRTALSRKPAFQRTRIAQLLQLGLLVSATAAASLLPIQSASAAPQAKRKSAAVAKSPKSPAAIAAAAQPAAALAAQPAGNYTAVSQDVSAPRGNDGSAGSCTFCITNGSGNGGDAPMAPSPAGISTEYVSGSSISGDATHSALSLTSNGATGGNGGNAAGMVDIAWSNGGYAANGTAGGGVTLTLDENTTTTSANGSPTLAITSNGGNGGQGGMPANYGKSGTQGIGGTGGTIDVHANGDISNGAAYTGTSLAPSAVVMTSVGGNGGGDDNNTAKTSSDHATGPNGGDGGDGGAINWIGYNTDGKAPSITSNGAGIVAVSVGGNGGQGAEANTTGTGGATGGDGGKGGNGGNILIVTTNTSISARGVDGKGSAEDATVDPSQPSVQAAQSFTSAAVVAQSFGGLGGQAGSGDGSFSPGKGGNGGAAGQGGNVAVYTGGNVTAQGYGAAGIVAQSIGGSGGNGATAGSVFKAHAGNGGVGGDANYAKVEADDFVDTSHGHAQVSTNGDDANAIVAQSIGGGGGNGGSVSVKNGLAVPVAIAIGGNGEKGGNGGQAEVDIGSVDPDSNALTPGAVVSTHGIRSAGVLAQSIGGGGGTGGSANATTVGGVLSLSIGGKGGTGGDAGTQGTQQVLVNNYGTIQTDGEHSAGIVAQAIGGGGGNGGAAQSLTVGAQVTTAVAVGGNGGTGGTAGDVIVNNHGQVLTEQNDSYGVLAQSIGGGGGNGGASNAETLNVFNSPDVPSVNMKTAVGGQGVSGGNAGNVTIDNSAFVTTRGAGSIGLYAQSVGGGGGNGGDSSVIGVSTQNSTVDLNVSVGGSGGAGGTGGTVNLTNDNGAVMTYGANAIGMFGQSVGGGGGNGGSASIDNASFLSENKGGQLTLAIGGNGGTGNVGGDVNVKNINGASVMTMGDGARGVSAQSIGGSGGIGGASTAGGSGGNIVVNISLAGNGGSGNKGGTVNVQNDGTVLTYGGKADAVFAQSVGGSGGIGGNAAAGGGTDPELRASDFLAKGMGIGGNVTTMGDNIYGFAKDEIVGDKAIDKLKDAAKNYISDEPAPETPAADADSKWSVTVDVGTAIGGTGGSGGDGGKITATNNGTVETDGANSAGIYAQSVGGSGGIGGTAQSVNNPQGLAQKNVPISGSIGVGGGGGSAGNGGEVDVTNTGSITTLAAASNGVTAQSVGGGGGEGGATVASWQQVHAFNVSLGGNGGANGDGGKVSVTMDGGNDGGAITTHGVSSNGIVAQSIGGGGGMITLMSAAPSSTAGGTMQSDISWLPQGYVPSLVPINIGGDDGEQNCGATGRKASGCGNGGEVDVTAANVTTTGANSHGIVAQSIGGGGGMLIGGAVGNGAYFGSNAMIGDGGKVNVTVDRQQAISTSGNGSYGILAQSIGGGGILAGDMWHGGNVGTAFSQKNANLSGNGNDVHVVVGAGSTVQTGGANAHAVVMQSIGGGGGLVATGDDGILMGTAGGSGNSGAVTLDNAGYISTRGGSGASAVVLNSDGQSGNTGSMTVNNAASGQIWGYDSAPAIKFVGNGSRLIQNSGFIANTNGTAVDGSGGNVDVSNNSGGQIYGNVDIGGETLHNNVGALWGTNDSSTAGLINNGGTIRIWGANFDQTGVSKLNGAIVSSGTIHSNVDFQNQQAGQLVVSGTAELMGGDISLTAKTMAPKPVTVLSAGYLDLRTAPVVHDDSAAQLYKYDVSFANNAVTVTPEAQLSAVAAKQGFSSSERSIADHLQAGFTTSMSAPMAENYAKLAALPSAAAYQTQLDRLGNEAAQTVGSAMLATSNSFVERMNSCPLFDATGNDIHEHDCAWTRADGQHVTRDGSGSPVGYEQENYMVQFGGQRGIGDGWFVGGSMGYDTSNLTSDVSHDVNGHGFSVGAMVKREVGDWVFSGAADFGRGIYDSERQVGFGDTSKTAKGEFGATRFGLHGRITRYVPMESWYLKPYADMHVTHMKTDAYDESGADELDLHVNSASDTIYTLSPMLEAGKRFDFGNGMTLRTYAAAGVAFYSRDDWSASSNFIGADATAGNFNASAELPNSRMKLNLGVNLLATAKLDMRLEYTGEFASGYRSNTGTLKLNYLF